MGGNFVVNLVMSGSMSQIWGMVESLQVVSHLHLFDVKTPGNVQSFMVFFNEITDFEVLPAEEWTDSMLYAPESVPPSLNFQQAGHDSSLFLPNLGSMFYIMLAYVGLYVFYFLVVWPLAKCSPKIERFSAKLKDFLLWNGTMRFFIESYMNITLFTLLNIKEYTWNDAFSLITISDVLAIVSLVITILLPAALLVFFACSISKWEDEGFARRNGTFFQGGDLEREHTQWIVLLIPLSYFVRRLLLSLTLVFWINFIWGQIAI